MLAQASSTKSAFQVNSIMVVDPTFDDERQSTAGTLNKKGGQQTPGSTP